MNAEAHRPRPSFVSSHPALVALGLYVLLAVAFFGRGLLPGHTVSAADYLWSAAPWDAHIPGGLYQWSSNPRVVGSNTQLIDAVTVFEPFLQYTRASLPHIPLWDPYIMGGTPYLGDMQSAVFSPFSLPAYFLPFWWSLGVIAVMKVVVAAMGVFLLARKLGTGEGGAFLAGVVYGFGLFMIAWLPWPLTNVFPLIPWMLLATEWLVRRPGIPSGCGLAAVVAVQFLGGHPETSMQAIFVTAGYFVLRLVQAPGGGAAAVAAASASGASRTAALLRAARRPAVAFVLAFAVGTALAGVVVLPFLELLRNSSDLSVRPRNEVHVRPKYFLAAFLPTYFPGSFEIETSFYVGALPLLLGAVSLLRPRVERVVIAVVAVLSVLVVLGIPPLFQLAAHTPGLDLTYLSRFTIVYLLCIALLAGFGLDDLVRRRPARRAAWAGGAGAVGLLLLPVAVATARRDLSLRFLDRAVRLALPFSHPISPTAPHDESVVRLAAVLVWVTVAGVAAVVVGLRLAGRIGPRLFACLAIALAVGDLFQAGIGYNPGIPESHAVQPVTPAIAYLERQAPARYVAVTPYDGVNPLPPDVNLRYGLYDLRGYDLPVISQFGQVWTRYVAPPIPLLPLDTPSVPLTIYSTVPTDSLRVLSLFGVKDILADAGDHPITNRGLHVVYEGADATIYANDNALPRAWLVSDEDVTPSPEAALEGIVGAGFDPRRVLLTETALPGLTPTGPGGSAGPPAGRARITGYGAEQVTVDAHANRPSELVLSDTWYPGWQVSVNGRPARIDRVDYLLRGVPVPAGNDRIVFTYAPASYRAGWAVSLAAVAVLLGALAFEVRRRRRAEPALNPGTTTPSRSPAPPPATG